VFTSVRLAMERPGTRYKYLMIEKPPETCFIWMLLRRTNKLKTVTPDFCPALYFFDKKIVPIYGLTGNSIFIHFKADHRQ
jgi:hypothetical protein